VRARKISSAVGVRTVNPDCHATVSLLDSESSSDATAARLRLLHRFEVESARSDIARSRMPPDRLAFASTAVATWKVDVEGCVVATT